MKDPDPRIKVTTVPAIPAHHLSVIASRPSYYVVVKGQKTGVYSTWDQCNKQVKGHSNAKFLECIIWNDAVSYAESCNNHKPTIKANYAKII